MCTRYCPPAQAEIERHWQVRPASAQTTWLTQLHPRAAGPFLRRADDADGQPSALQLMVGQWGLVPPHATSARLPYATVNARCEGIARRPAFRAAWQAGQRCLVPVERFFEPCWETGRNVWWQFRRLDGAPWALAGLWNVWSDPVTGQLLPTYTLLTVNADGHPWMGRMHKPDPALPADQQDKRSVVAIAPQHQQAWLSGAGLGAAELAALLVPLPAAETDAAPEPVVAPGPAQPPRQASLW